MSGLVIGVLIGWVFKVIRSASPVQVRTICAEVMWLGLRIDCRVGDDALKVLARDKVSVQGGQEVKEEVLFRV
jgi:hypothetical protein